MGESGPSGRDELGELVADLRASLEWSRACGARALPVGDVAWPVREEEPATRGGEGLAAIRADLGDCRRCRLCEGRTNIVFGVGSPMAELVIVGEAPGYDEDRKGEPFVGKAGQMLDKMIGNVLGRRREDVYIANCLKCRPPENRDPMPDEIATCRPFLDAQLAAISPRVLLLLGRHSAQTLLGTTRGIKALRGEWQVVRLSNGNEVPAMPTFHPAYLLRQPQDKRLVWEDLLKVKERLDSGG